MPLTSMIPMLFRAPAPGPEAKTSGKWPNTVAAVVHSEALGQGCLGLVFQVCQRLIKWHRRRNHALNTHSIELLELVQRARLGRRLQAGKSRERHELVV